MLHLLDILKKAMESDRKKLDADPDETISDEDSKFDQEKININSSEIKDIYVS